MNENNQSILAVNVGSSSIKFTLYAIENNAIKCTLLKGKSDHLDEKCIAKIEYEYDYHVDCDEFYIPEKIDKFDAVLEKLTSKLNELFPTTVVVAIGHRVVHGGQKYFQSVIITKEVIDDLMGYIPLAPLHQPHNVDGIHIFSKYFSDAIQIACFDTAFHRTLPDIEKTYPIPTSLKEKGIIRYGFHGLSYQYICQTLEQLTDSINRKSILIHLGNGASMCACLHQKSVATSMGFSTLDGLMMGTRSGSIDPGILIYLLRQHWSVDDIENMLYHDSGLKGVSGISSDMLTLRQSHSPHALFAINLFIYEMIKSIGMLIAILNGVDLIVFTGGIGEHDAQLRQDFIRQISYFGAKIDDEKNTRMIVSNPKKISRSESAVEIWVVPTDEELIVAQEVLRLYKSKNKSL
ncbi:MAG: acetate/propionate family kinase [Betaproteobacteria bacterium]|nr:acetate/propionate family kinase [Betaproteobacteria bacterium]